MEEINQEEATTAPAKTEQAPAEATKAAPTSGTDVSVPNAAQTAPAKTALQTGQDGQDWSKKYEALEKSYAELRRKLVEQGTEKNQYQKQFEQMNQQLQAVHKGVAQVTKKPFEFGQFLEDLQSRGPEALFDNIKEPLTEQVKAYELGLKLWKLRRGVVGTMIR